MTSTTRLDRATGAMLGLAVGDALGAPYEFQPPQRLTLTGTATDMTGGGQFQWKPGEWTDDTSMAIPILRAVADGLDLLAPATQDRIVTQWRDWALTANDVGIQTRRVLAALREPTAEHARIEAYLVHEEAGRSGGNGSLMRTAPVALAHLGRDDPHAVAATARALSDLTHFEDDAGDACALWTVGIWQAVRTGRVSMADAVATLPHARRQRWEQLVAQAEAGVPGDFVNNGWVVHALQAAWSAITRAGLDPADPATHTTEAFRTALERAINAGSDTDTVAAITGMLVGAMVGAEAIPVGWLERLQGWPGLEAQGLADLVAQAHAHVANQ